MSVQTKVENYLNYVTGSAGGWPANTNVGIIVGIRLYQRRNHR